MLEILLDQKNIVGLVYAILYRYMHYHRGTSVVMFMYKILTTGKVSSNLVLLEAGCFRRYEWKAANDLWMCAEVFHTGTIRIYIFRGYKLIHAIHQYKTTRPPQGSVFYSCSIPDPVFGVDYLEERR